ncbi:hypothetical protein [Candidatus Poriferisocius sp.]|uniref:hypothetical protein n=1 Tax=Candidatus Poriferisocius sp. TaxID=3101276 RepID=UPI003B599F5D
MNTFRITPQPTEAQVAAIMAAFEALRPRPAAVAPIRSATAGWRFSGRWWTTPGAPLRRSPTLRR